MEVDRLKAENAELRKEVARIKQQLIMEEIRNGGKFAAFIDIVHLCDVHHRLLSAILRGMHAAHTGNN